MKQRLIAAGLALALTAAACERKPPATGASQVLTVPGFKTPESVKYDPDLDLYFVTNINGNPSAKDNNGLDRKSTRLNSSHLVISYAVFCLKKKKTQVYAKTSGLLH